MGFYYENGMTHGKAESLIKEHNACIISPDRAKAAIEEGDSAVMCVFQNPNFDAAAYIYSIEEFNRVHLDSTVDPRVKTFLEVPDKAMIEKLTKYDQSLMAKQKTSHLYN